MEVSILPADRPLLNLLAEGASLTLPELASRLSVTRTAIRQRMTRLQGAQLVTRTRHVGKRGRPGYCYSLTTAGKQTLANNFADLASILWDEVRSVSNLEVRRGLLDRLAKRMAGAYGAEIAGAGLADRMTSVAELFGRRGVELVVDSAPVGIDSESHEEVATPQSGLPVLRAMSCPYPTLAERDRGICALERQLFSELVGTRLRLAECRLDGDCGCTFVPVDALATVSREDVIKQESMAS